jgi:glycine oxidase
MPAQGWLERIGRGTGAAMSEAQLHRYDAVVVGGGAIGLACAWRAARRGARVAVLERNQPASGATGVAAGMLAPVGEASWGEETLLALNQESLRGWPQFAGELEADAGVEVGYRECGALHVALDRDEAEELRRRQALQRELELDSEWLRPSECRRLEPGLTPTLSGGVHAAHEAAADPRRLSAALLAALERQGADVNAGAEVVDATRGEGGWTVSVADGRGFAAKAVVLAAGCWSAASWLPEGTRPPLRPVKGEILTLGGSPEDPLCERIVAGERVYLVPRPDGRLIVGATVEERGFDTTVTAGGVHELLREAYRLLPEVAELELLEAAAGLRPGTPDNAPLIGHGAEEGLILATGHYRNGILLAPVTADCVAAVLAGESPPVALEAFSPLRFARSSSELGVGAR